MGVLFCIQEFKNCDMFDVCSVSLHGCVYQLHCEIESMKLECAEVSRHLRCSAVTGSEASKKRFLQELESATIIHIG